ncbi:hypothetical protein DFR49_3608 [Hephaestia caeni]|uniref:DUF6438 domain-containing protein n=1 Tax=Hephaestia caeni TaxID=645617 RepID=A0A397NJM4_9SPHN|nr:DUF6438 domain-containing protein [Hephaestia caeni]RIA37720.1 hypothetical protein DFR49_3608 [Hephaestia caeni]
MRSILLLAPLIALAGCVAGGSPAPTPGDSATITYATQPCFGACPVYTVAVSPDGQGVFTGKRFTAVTGERTFTVPRDAYDRFAAALAPYRPENGEVRYEMGSDNCGMAPTDQPSADVTWTSVTGANGKLHFYYGCARENPDLAGALRSAPDLLPIGEMIGKR